MPGGFAAAGLGGGNENAFNQFMEGQGYRLNRGRWSRTKDMGRLHSSRESMSQQTARDIFGAQAAPNLADQGMAAAMSDYESLSQIIGAQNRDRAAYQNDLIAQQDRIESDRIADREALISQGEEGADRIAQSGRNAFDEFASHRDEVQARAERHAEQVKAFTQGVLDNYDENALGSISAGAAGIAQATQSQLSQIEAEGRARGLSEDAISSMKFQAKGRGLQQMQSAISPMIDQKNQMKLQAGMQASQIYGQALGNATSIAGQGMALTEQALARREQHMQASEQFRMASRMNAVQANNTYHQARMALGEQRANALRNLTQQYPSQFDTLMQAAFSAQQFGDRSAINFDAFGVT